MQIQIEVETRITEADGFFRGIVEFGPLTIYMTKPNKYRQNVEKMLMEWVEERSIMRE